MFIGDVKTDISSLLALDNVVFLGPKPHHVLPSYAQHWSVSMLPFKDNAQIRACNPLKLREYMAAGTAIISTAFPAMQPYRQHLYLANTQTEFQQALERAHTETSNNRLERQYKVKSESWSQRASDVQALLKHL